LAQSFAVRRLIAFDEVSAVPGVMIPNVTTIDAAPVEEAVLSFIAEPALG
jgi:hypothetical protein